MIYFCIGGFFGIVVLALVVVAGSFMIHLLKKSQNRYSDFSPKYVPVLPGNYTSSGNGERKEEKIYNETVLVVHDVIIK